ncbi:hypothetical protein IAD21_03796 [Abditibacteriota bacterium]|nr:hypothetical protein IAD21_03796 [Abditibacteriota bacterium]
MDDVHKIGLGERKCLARLAYHPSTQRGIDAFGYLYIRENCKKEIQAFVDAFYDKDITVDVLFGKSGREPGFRFRAGIPMKIIQ